MAKERIPGGRLFPGSEGPDRAERANAFPITTHDRLEHLAGVVKNKRTFALRLEALGRVLEEARLAAKNAARAAESVAPIDGTPSAIAHSLEQEIRKVTDATRRQEREVSSLEQELTRERGSVCAAR